MKVDIKEVEYIAKLAKLKFSDEETLKLSSEFESILSHFESIDKLNLDDIKIDIEDDLKPVLRDDEAKYFEDKKKLFQNTKSMKDTAIMVPKIIE
ncbi:MAG: Asp-tRNA(Asn)/Glu-tRNA(Gln) amidotransferase subunit GatC [Clostridiaceae bacterium]|nr:Asp-tRNA(Asn)/Glu-tRNA(Gln) amidotransferase subunit GatC [Clostridiaceae bacterium]